MSLIETNLLGETRDKVTTAIERMVKLTRDAKDYCMLKKVAKDCDCIIITPEDIKELQNTAPAAALSVLQKVLGMVK